MGSASLATIRGVVRERGDYPRSPKMSDAYVNGEIQASWRELYEIVDDVNEGWWDTTADVSTVASQAYIALPTGCWRVKGVDLIDGGEPIPLDQVGIGDRYRFGTSAAKPCAYRTSARGIELYPTPDAVYTLRFVYAPVAPDLEEAVARDYVNNWDEYTIISTLLKLDTREERPLADRERALDRAWARVKSSASKRRQAEPEYLNLREDGFDPSVRKGYY